MTNTTAAPATTAKATNLIKRFTGFIAPDGSTHDTAKKAADHTIKLQEKAAAEELATKLFAGAEAVGEGFPGFTDMDNSAGYNPGITNPKSLAELLVANKADILAIFKQEVRLRAPRKPKTKSVAPSGPASLAGLAP